MTDPTTPLSADFLGEMDRLLGISAANGREPIRVTHGELLALVAAARELEWVKAVNAALFPYQERAVAAEKERDELRNRVAELEYAVRHPDDPAYAKGREDERAACVAWLRGPDCGMPVVAAIIERGEHVGRVAGDGGTGQG